MSCFAEVRSRISESRGAYSTNVDLYMVAFGIDRPVAEVIDKEYSLRQLNLVSAERLKAIPGIGDGVAARIVAAFEIGRRAETYIDDDKRKFRSPRDVYAYLFPMYRGDTKERFRCLYLDTKNQLLKDETVSIGSLNASIVHPREVFKVALELSAASVILTHNHPSGDPSPSREDILVTEKLVEGGKLLGVNVLDHIIIGEGGYVSLKDEGYVV